MDCCNAASALLSTPWQPCEMQKMGAHGTATKQNWGALMCVLLWTCWKSFFTLQHWRIPCHWVPFKSPGAKAAMKCRFCDLWSILGACEVSKSSFPRSVQGIFAASCVPISKLIQLQGDGVLVHPSIPPSISLCRQVALCYLGSAAAHIHLPPQMLTVTWEAPGFFLAGAESQPDKLILSPALHNWQCTGF